MLRDYNIYTSFYLKYTCKRVNDMCGPTWKQFIKFKYENRKIFLDIFVFLQG